jgi:D-alanyl-D-alanine carboxypeptidase
VVLAAAVAAGCGSSAGEPPARPAHATPTATPTPTPAAVDPPPVTAIVWGLERPARAARRLRRHPAVAAAAPVGRGVVLLRSGVGADGRVVQRVRAGYAVPLDTLAADPRRYAATLPAPHRGAFAKLRPGRAILSTTSSELRKLGAGGVLRLADERRLRVVAVVDDAVLRDAEVALASTDPRVQPLRSTVIVLLRAPVAPRELLRRTERDAAARIVDGAGPVGPARPAQLKVMFGEPAVGLPYGDDWVRLDPVFVRRHIVTRTVPILGSVTCHRAMMRPLRAALASLARRGLSRLVDPGDYAGCYAPRRIRPRGQLSLHAWGVAIDLNASANPFMGRSRQDRRLVRAMERQGFTWGGDWPTRPDPMHFELRNLPPS